MPFLFERMKMENTGTFGINNTEIFLEALKKGEPEIPIELGRFNTKSLSGTHTDLDLWTGYSKSEHYMSVGKISNFYPKIGGDTTFDPVIPHFRGKVRKITWSENDQDQIVVSGKYFIYTGADWHEERIRQALIRELSGVGEQLLVAWAGLAEARVINGVERQIVKSFKSFSFQI